jgi:predicted membrane chloride channel (bestrophin family)
MKLLSYCGHSLIRKALLSVLVVLLAKLAAHWLGWEVISLNPLFSGLVAANVFLMGFLLSGVLADYKESERLPGELSASIETIADELLALKESEKAPVARDGLERLLHLAESIKDWFHKRHSTREAMDHIADLRHLFLRMEPLIPANYIARLKQEQSNLRRVLIRMHTIRETSFVTSGYVISESVTVLLTVGLVLAKIDPFYESLFFVSMITFLFSFLGLLIRDLDNPFGHYEADSAEDVSLKPIQDTIARLRALGGTAG